MFILLHIKLLLKRNRSVVMLQSCVCLFHQSDARVSMGHFECLKQDQEEWFTLHKLNVWIPSACLWTSSIWKCCTARKVHLKMAFRPHNIYWLLKILRFSRPIDLYQNWDSPRTIGALLAKMRVSLEPASFGQQFMLLLCTGATYHCAGCLFPTRKSSGKTLFWAISSYLFDFSRPWTKMDYYSLSMEALKILLHFGVNAFQVALAIKNSSLIMSKGSSAIECTKCQCHARNPHLLDRLGVEKNR